MTAQESDSSTAILSKIARAASKMIKLRNFTLQGHFTGRPNHAVLFEVLQLLFLIVDEPFNLVTWC